MQFFCEGVLKMNNLMISHISIVSKKISMVLSLLIMALFIVSCTEGKTPTVEVTVTQIEVTQLPTKTEYYIDEVFSIEGGTITVTYSDGTTEIKSLSDEGVIVSEVTTDMEGQLTVTVRYMDKNARFNINVVAETFIFTIDLNHDGITDVMNDVVKGSKVTRPADPTREGYTFDNWYSDTNLTVVYDFNTAVNEDTIIYAKWLEIATYYNFIFNYNQDRLKVPTVTQKVKEDDKAVVLSTQPTRVGYQFDGWYTEADGGSAFNFDNPITSDTTVYAKWTRTTTGVNTWIFEAEDTNLAGKSGPGLSGTLSGPGMIQYTTEHGASNDRFVGYLYEYGLSLEFNFVSDMAVNDATIYIRLSAEIRDFSINSENFLMSLNNIELDYGTINFTNVPPSTAEDQSLDCLPFADFLVVENVSLNKGMNIFQVVTLNYETTPGTTLTAIAPLVDCIKITTSAVLTWDDFLGLPKDNY
jgi:uncharacterized repeat protein (TIGR02543 family)